MRAAHALTLVLALSLVAACDKDAPPSQKPSGEKPASEEPSGDKPAGDKPTTDKAADPAEPALDAPDKVINAGVKALQEHRPVAVWNLLPKSWQLDIQSVYDVMLASLDPQIFDLDLQLLDKARKAVDKHEAKLIEAFPERRRDDVRIGLPLARQAHDLWTKIGVKDHASAKKVQVGGLTAKHGADISKFIHAVWKAGAPRYYGEFMVMLGTLEAKIVEPGERSATVEIKVGGDSDEVPMMKHEGRWVPTEMVKEWSSAIAEIKEEIGDETKRMAKYEADAKTAIKAMSAALDGFIDSGDVAALQKAMGEACGKRKCRRGLEKTMAVASMVMSEIGRGHASGASDLIKVTKEYTDKVCAAPSSAQAVEIQKEFAEKMQAAMRDGDYEQTPDDTQMQQLQELTKKMAECMMAKAKAEAGGGGD